MDAPALRTDAFKILRTRCFPAAHIISYFVIHGAPRSELLKGVAADWRFIANPDNWLPYEDFSKILDNCQRLAPQQTLDDWTRVGQSVKVSEEAQLFRGMIMLTGPQAFYAMIPKLTRRVCNYQQGRIIRSKKRHADLVIQGEPQFIQQCNGISVRWGAGVLAMIPPAVGLAPASVQILYDQALVKNIIEILYRHLNLNYEERHGRIWVDGQPLGRRVRLISEMVDGQQVLTSQYDDHPPYNAVIIEADLCRKDRILLHKGDIFEAPYARLQFDWPPTVGDEPVPVSLADNKRVAQETFSLLEKQMELAEQRFFDSEELRLKAQQAVVQMRNANQALADEISERRKAEVLLKIREEQLQISNVKLQEANTALKVLLEKGNHHRDEVGERALQNVQTLIIPYLNKLKESAVDVRQRVYTEIIEANLKELLTSFTHTLASRRYGLTKAEIRVANLVRMGRNSRQIAQTLKISRRTVETYRLNIRQKMKLKNRKINLRTYLTSLE
jgi:DNA-binding CsgD family transcriptional regulator